jgi:uncharacterized iron-regulated protein
MMRFNHGVNMCPDSRPENSKTDETAWRRSAEDTATALLGSAYQFAGSIKIPQVEKLVPGIFRAGEQLLLEPLAMMKGAEKTKHIEEQINEADLKTLEHLNKTKDELIEIKKEINQKGRTPSEHVVDLMKKNRVVGLGEMHTTPNGMRDFGKAIMSDLQKAGATHLALEIDVGTQPVIDEYMKTGKIDRTKLPALLQSDDFIAIMDEARSAKMKIVCVDTNPKRDREHDRFEFSSVDRDKDMADRIGKILDENEKNKVVFWVGSLHLSRKYGDHATVKSAADYVKERHTMATVQGETDDHSFSPLITLTPDLKKPVALSMTDATRVAALRESYLKESSLNLRYAHWDNVVVFPARPRK